MKNTLKAKYTINSFDINPEGKARLTTIANFLQETAYKHAASLELGYQHLAENNRAWVLSRMQIQTNRYPDWDEEVTVETWPRGIDKLFALRDFRMYGQDGIEIAIASTCWLMVDTETHRPLRIPNEFIKIETRTDSVFEYNPGKIELPDLLESCEMRKVKYSDMDVVGHVNNVKYIEWCIDALDHRRLSNGGIQSFTINYIAEAKMGEQVELQCDSASDHQIMISGTNRSSEKECFRAKLKF